MIVEIEGTVVFHQSPQGWHACRLPCVYLIEDMPVMHEHIHALLDWRSPIGLLPVGGHHPLDFCRRESHLFCDLRYATYSADVQARFGKRRHDLLVRVRFLANVVKKSEPVSTEIRRKRAL